MNPRGTKMNEGPFKRGRGCSPSQLLKGQIFKLIFLVTVAVVVGWGIICWGNWLPGFQSSINGLLWPPSSTSSSSSSSSIATTVLQCLPSLPLPSVPRRSESSAYYVCMYGCTWANEGQQGPASLAWKAPPFSLWVYFFSSFKPLRLKIHLNPFLVGLTFWQWLFWNPASFERHFLSFFPWVGLGHGSGLDF